MSDGKADLSHLVRYYIVDRYDKPWSVAPAKMWHTVEDELRRINGRHTDDVQGIPERRPYRAIKLVPQELPEVRKPNDE